MTGEEYVRAVRDSVLSRALAGPRAQGPFRPPGVTFAEFLAVAPLPGPATAGGEVAVVRAIVHQLVREGKLTEASDGTTVYYVVADKRTAAAAAFRRGRR